MKTRIVALVAFLFALAAFAADSTTPAATAINSFGLDLLRKTSKPDANALLSPYSIGTALVMTYGGSDGVTKDEMTKVLHLGSDEARTHKSFNLLQRHLDDVVRRSAELSARRKLQLKTFDPITLTIANRLFGQQQSIYYIPFLDLLRTNYLAPLQPLDLAKDPAGSAKIINDWVEQQTQNRISDLIPAGAINPATRLVLANAIYLKAPWDVPFKPGLTESMPFQAPGGAAVQVPTMAYYRQSLGYTKFKDFTAVAIPYSGGEIQFLILLPDRTNGLAELEGKVPDLDKCANLPARDIALYLPKFKIEPPTLALADALQAMGMKSAFDPFSANFDRMAQDTLYISAVYHKTFLKLDEQGTEAAAATAVVAEAREEVAPTGVVVKVDHPFLFAIQHRASGACLFLGHVVDPR